MIPSEYKKYMEYYLNLIDLKEESPRSSLFTGFSGIVLVLTELSQITPDSRHIALLDRYLQRLTSDLEKTDFYVNTFCDGIAGIGWLILYLKEAEHDLPLSIDDYFDTDDFLNELDTVLSKSLDYNKTPYFDLLHGELGIGLYFLKRNDKEIPTKIIYQLKEFAVQNGNETKWSRFDSYIAKDYIYDFGLAHGNSGILYFLCKCYERNILPEVTKDLIQGVLKFYFNNLQEGNIVWSNFPTSILVESYVSGSNKPQNSRLAWCYGDLGVLHTILLASKKLDLNDYENRAIQLLKQTAARKSMAETSLVDNQFCHGRCGVAAIYLSVYYMTDDVGFQQASEYWANELYKDIDENFKNGEKAFFYLGEKVGWKETTGTLDGFGGIILHLISSFDRKRFNRWAEMFFLI